MLKIEAQSSSSRHRFGPPHNPLSALDTTIDPSAPPQTPHRDPSPDVLVAVIHSPLHIGCFLQPPTAGSSVKTQEQQRCPSFSLSSPACAGVFPLRRCDWGQARGTGAGAGAALFSAAAAVEGREGDRSAEGGVSAEEVPRDERLRFRCANASSCTGLLAAVLLVVGG